MCSLFSSNQLRKGQQQHVLQKQSQILPGFGPCPKDEQFLPVQSRGLHCASNVPVLLTWARLCLCPGTAAGLAEGGFAPMDKVARYF